MIEHILERLDKWHTKKREVAQNRKTIFVKERDIVFLTMGQNIGVEQDGKGSELLRPVVVYKKFNNSQFLGIPLTSKVKQGKHYFEFQYLSSKKSYAILSQVRVFDVKRIKYKSGTISKKSFQKLYKDFCDLVTPTECRRVPKEYR
jgi:ABC-type molybdate transport system substrate-binding protein